MLRRFRVGILALVLPIVLVTTGNTQTPPPPPAGTIAGTAMDAAQQPLANATVNVMSIDSSGASHLLGTTIADNAGKFSISNLPVGSNYTIQILQNGHLIGVAGGVSVTATGVTVAAVTGVTTATAAIGAAIITSTAVAISVTAASVAGAIVATEATTSPASPSR